MLLRRSCCGGGCRTMQRYGYGDGALLRGCRVDCRVSSSRWPRSVASARVEKVPAIVLCGDDEEGSRSCGFVARGHCEAM
jgi:threonyl-tRNA synthetase